MPGTKKVRDYKKPTPYLNGEEFTNLADYCMIEGICHPDGSPNLGAGLRSLVREIPRMEEARNEKILRVKREESPEKLYTKQELLAAAEYAVKYTIKELEPTFERLETIISRLEQSEQQSPRRDEVASTCHDPFCAYHHVH